MKLLKRAVTMIWVLALIVTGCVLYLFNATPVSIDLVWLQLPDISLAVALLATFVVGLFSGGLLTLLITLWPKKKRMSS